MTEPTTTNDTNDTTGSEAGTPLRVHHLRPAPGAHTPKTRVGRGEAGKGKTAGRGTKGSGARKNMRLGFEGGQLPLQARLPQLKGFRSPFRTEYQVVNLDQLSAAFPQGGPVEVAELVRRGLVRKNRPVKVLGDGEASVALQVRANAFSASAKAKITEAGGSAEQI